MAESKGISNPRNTDSANETRNPYLDVSLAQRFISSDDQKHIKQHNTLKTKSKIAKAFDLYKEKMKRNPMNATQFHKFCERNSLHCKYSECVQYLKSKKDSYKVGDKVIIKPNREGQIKWIGEAKEFGFGKYFGIRLTEKRGDCDGEWKNKRFFQCPPGFGVYILLRNIVKRVDLEQDYMNEEDEYQQKALRKEQEQRVNLKQMREETRKQLQQLQKLREERRQKNHRFNVRLCGNGDRNESKDDDIKIEEKQVHVFKFEEKKDLEIPQVIATDPWFNELIHGTDEQKESQCNVFPMDVFEDDTTIIPFTLDINIKEFFNENTENNLDTFFKELANILEIDTSIMNGLCVSEGSSIIWIKMKNISKESLQKMIDIFVKPKQNITKFIDKFKLNINKTIDIAAKTFKHTISKFKKRKPVDNKQIDNNNAEINKWMNEHIDKLYPIIYDSLKFCHYDFQIIDCMVIDVPKRIKAFQQHPKYNHSKLLFHGTKTEHFASIINDGFLDRAALGKSHRKGRNWYGKGFYFTSYPVYALRYYCMENNESFSSHNLCATLIASLVNVGNVREIYGYCHDVPIPKQFDCNHIRVFGTGWKRFHPAPIGHDDKVKVAELCVCGFKLSLKYANEIYHETASTLPGHQLSSVECNNCGKKFYSDEELWHCQRQYLDVPDHKKGYDLCKECFVLRRDELCGKNTKFASTNDRIYDEYAVRDSSRIIPRYLIKLQRIKTVFIWRNTTFDQYPNAPIYQEIAKTNVVYVCKDSLTALKVIELKKWEDNKLYIISNGRDGKQFVGKQVMDTLGIPSNNILIFTGSPSYVKQWANVLNVEVTGSPDRVKSFVLEKAKMN